MKVRLLAVFMITVMMCVPTMAQDVDIDSITFARDVSVIDLTPIQADTVFPSSMNTIYAIVEGDGLEPGETVEFAWIRGDDEVMASNEWENTLDSDEFGFWAFIANDTGLADGDWRVEVYYDDDLIASEEFEITDDEYIYPIRFAEGCGRSTTILIDEDTEFEEITEVYALIEYANFDEETVRALWTIDDEVYDLNLETDFDGDATFCFFVGNNGNLLPEGEYTIIITDEDGDEFRESAEIDITD